jgi:hypothetical protein
MEKAYNKAVEMHKPDSQKYLNKKLAMEKGVLVYID